MRTWSAEKYKGKENVSGELKRQKRIKYSENSLCLDLDEVGVLPLLGGQGCRRTVLASRGMVELA